MALRKVLVANRGEIAVRIVRAARDLGLETVQVHSQADRDMLAVQLADEAVEIGPAPAGRSYLDIEAILGAARASGADAVHPGYGFLSENADFAQAVRDAKMVFVGPEPETIRAMGDKAAARAFAKAAGAPVAAGSEGVLEDLSTGPALAEEIGYPVMVKAAAGGGGRGIRVAYDRAELERMLPEAAREAKAGFGNAGLYLERFVPRARHVEVQVLGDGRSAVHLHERECSLQRRRQKLWEEAPAVALPPSARTAICASAVRLAVACRYRGAGTLEYLYDEEGDDVVFIEMNTRIQVEHPVTEMTTGVDLVAAGLRIAGGAPHWLTQEAKASRGPANEGRINAEDPARAFAPCPGVVDALHVPGGFGVRFDTLLYPGCTVPPFYDSLIGKLIVWAETREAALGRLRRALDELRIGGVATTTPLLAALARDPEVAAGRVHTRWLGGWLDRAKAGGGW